MTFDPYAILGLDRTASAGDIRKAYRGRAKDTHPDAEGGSKEAFEDIAKAFAILADPRRRAQFDQTGTYDDAAASADPIFAQAVGYLGSVVIHEALENDMDPLNPAVDLMAALRGFIASESQPIKDKQRTTRRALDRIDKLEKRLKRKKGEGDDVVMGIFKWKRDLLQQLLAAVDFDLAVRKKADAILAEYEIDGFSRLGKIITPYSQAWTAPGNPATGY
jgi:curved DNA-binding protein CbpA